MRSGVIGIVDGDFQDITPEQNEITQNGYQLKRCLEIRENHTLSDGTSVQEGRAAMEELRDVEDVRIQNGSIGTFEQPEKTTRYTEFLSLPGKAIIVGSGSGTFAFDLIGRNTESLIDRANLDLRAYYEQNVDADVWQAGFYGTGGEAENGVLYGNDVMEDSEFDRVLEYADLNQLGMEYSYDSDAVKITTSESGYVNLYQPSNYDSKEFMEFFKDEILQYVRRS